MNQKGFAPIVLFLIILVAAGGGYVVVKDNPSLIQKALAPNLQIAGPSNLPSAAKVEEDKINITGKYDFGNNQSVIYTFNLPKNGGQVDGQLTGSCNGKITGAETTPSKDGQSSISGRIEGECRLPNLPFSIKLLASFDGLVNFRESKLSLNYNLEQPISAKSNLEIPFDQPIKIPNSNPSSAEQPSRQTSNTQVTQDKVIYTGLYKIGDTHGVSYSISFPRNGGEIVGSGSGDCQVNISGQVDTNLSQAKRPISGTIKANCQSLAPVTDKTVFNGTFWGSLDDNKGKIEIIHNGILDTNSNGYLETAYPL